MNKEQLIDLLDNMGALVIVINRGFQVVYTNLYALRGRAKPEGDEPVSVGKLLRCARHCEFGSGEQCGYCRDCDVRRLVIDTLAHPDQPTHSEAGLNVMGADGSVRRIDTFVRGKCMKVDDEDCVVLTLFDITSFKHFADELAKARAKAEESERMKTKFLQCMSHEIRTPLNAIVGFSELLTQTDNHEDKQLYIDIINTNNELLLKLISDILDMAKIESGTLEISPKPTEVSSLIRLAEQSARIKLQPGVTLNTALGANECMVVTDPALLGQVIMNLLINACKFTSKGSITFGYEEYEDELYFFVKDTGIGISPEFKERLFDLFEKDDNFTQGLGLGLPISNAIVKKLGGNIGVESRGPGRGSTFWFTIPYNRPGEGETAAQGAGASAAVDEAGAAPVRHRITILVAEDNDSNYLLFQTILKKKYDVERAADGLEAVEMYKRIKPDLILMDINMPNMDGYEAVREIRKMSTDVPVIAVTAYAFVTDRQRILENGFNGYVSKPINMTRLEQEINNCLNNK